MTLQTKIFTTVLLSTLAMTAKAEPIEQLQQFNREIKSASGDFNQKILSKSGTVKKSSSGTFIFSRPGKFRWTYSTPYEQILVSNGKNLTIFDKDLNQVTTRSLGSSIDYSPADILFGNTDLSKNFTLTASGVKDGREWLSAIPKTKSSNFIKVNIGMLNGVPNAMELYDTLGQVTVLTFSNFKKNSGAAASSFNFTAPVNASIVK